MPINNVAEITIDEVTEAWGNYYLNSGQNLSNLHMLPFEESDTQTSGTIIETDQTVLREALVRTDELLQQYQEKFTSKGDLSVVPVNIFLQRVKIDLGIVPARLQGTWMQFLAASGNDPLQYPFIQWLVENYIVKKGKEDFELKSIYGGVFEPPVEGEAGEAAKVIDGIEILQNRLVAADKVDVLATGDLDTMTPKDMVTAIEEEFVKQIPEKYRYNIGLELNMSRTRRDRFRQGMGEKYNIYYAQTDQLTKLRYFENVTVVGRASMANKKRIWATPKENLYFPVKGFSNKTAFDLQKFERVVKFLGDWWQGVGFIQPELIFMNEGEAA